MYKSTECFCSYSSEINAEIKLGMTLITAINKLKLPTKLRLRDESTELMLDSSQHKYYFIKSQERSMHNTNNNLLREFS